MFQTVFSLKAEDTGLEPATPYGAIDFESTRLPIRLSSWQFATAEKFLNPLSRFGASHGGGSN